MACGRRDNVAELGKAGRAINTMMTHCGAVDLGEATVGRERLHDFRLHVKVFSAPKSVRDGKRSLHGWPH
jgi:hypothetical protein